MEARASPPVRSGIQLLVLRKGIPRQGAAVAILRHLHLNSGRIRRANFRRTQHGKLRKHFIKDTRHEIVLPILGAPPHLTKTDRFHSHNSKVTSYRQKPSMTTSSPRRRIYVGTAALGRPAKKYFRT